MTPPIRSSLRILAAVTTIAFINPGYAADGEWPTKPIRLIVPFPAGGSTDVAARQFSEQLSMRIKQPVIVENIGGANGTIALAQLARSEPDGYTLAVASNGNMLINRFLYSKLPFSLETAFTPIAVLCEYTNILVVKSDSPYKTIGDLLQDGKDHPGQLNYGSAGPGSSNHVAGYMLAQQANMNAVHIPYKGSGPAMMDLMGGNISFMFDNLLTSKSQIQAARIRVLATAGNERLDQLPDVPTVAETLPGYESRGWFALYGPAHLPNDITERISQEVAGILQDQSFTERLVQLGFEFSSSTPSQFRERIQKESADLKPVMEELNIKLD